MIKREETMKVIINRLIAGILFGILCGVTLFVTSRHFVNQEVTPKWLGLIAGVKQEKVEPFNKMQSRQDNLPENKTPEELLPP
ncbi:MAG: hypothetical protein LBL79_05540 [Prevotella sp.]|jgi:hypothetical protein|nr:hypothetical protein [Prevotella sp.]